MPFGRNFFMIGLDPFADLCVDALTLGMQKGVVGAILDHSVPELPLVPLGRSHEGKERELLEKA